VTTRVDDVLRLGDDALIAAQRLGSWYASSPEMEEDVAMANIGLDQLGAARLLLTYAGTLEDAGAPEGAGRDEDALAYLRSPEEFRNCRLVERPEPDFGHVIAKLLFLSAFQLPLYIALRSGADEQLAAIGAKACKESAYHLDHSSLWTVRLGDGTAVSHDRMQAAVDTLWPYVDELFAGGVAGLSFESLRPAWESTVDGVLASATLRRPAVGAAPPEESRDELVALLAEMQELHRAHPGARW
jgi:ring-1,2-phenylacetyl-CoA epoxidase subunit PaaC